MTIFYEYSSKRSSSLFHWQKMIDPKRDNKATTETSGLFNCPQVFNLIASMLSDTHQWSSIRSTNVRHLSCKQFIRQVDTAVNDKMFGLKYGPRKMTLEKPLVGRFRLPSVRKGSKSGAPAEIGRYHMYASKKCR